MKSFVTVLAILVIVGLGVAIVSAKPDGTAKPDQVTAATSTLTADLTYYDFGTIQMAKGNVTKTFNVTASSSVLIDKIETSCMCTTATAVIGGKQYGPFGMPGHGGPNPSLKQTLPAGEMMPVTVTFDPAAHGPSGVGVIERQIAITDSSGAALVLSFKANVIP